MMRWARNSMRLALLAFLWKMMKQKSFGKRRMDNDIH
ncbi:Uncharacterised protein [Legionella busanensis]|uniref:Uncharacterized protein n=1 Tax=Legionella busanensis TaxID=190655 RepID=A0A378JNE9_9GAMM|nr:Uncharacterised protein [Legionella busanensis]